MQMLVSALRNKLPGGRGGTNGCAQNYAESIVLDENILDPHVL